ncbi:CsiV family protein [Thalassotalea castellviae]|uniref:CsiV family protein n=1 Tax=Thalassotalea castellviae TaxID=3075612 RepID=A0ABU2ZZ35_9GAMM|nr:CsiV family protein [Thalassotalea sp. W431]MDT0602597.1 CsiV family protein [Thalassotalea sp. W431]
MNIKQSLVLLSSLFFSLSAMSASKWLGDWFEIEVILLSQLDDKAKLKEAFTEQNFSIDYRHSLDLFTPFLNPDIASLKQHLPVCNQQNDLRTYVEQSAIWPRFYQNKTLSTLMEEQLAEQQTTANNNNIELTAVSPLQTDDNDNNQQQTDFPVTNNNILEREQLNTNSTVTPELDEEVDVIITEAQQALVLEAEQVFAAKQFPNIDVYPHYAKTSHHQNDTSVLCQIPESEFNQLNVNEDLYSYHGFLVNKVPNVLDAAANIYSEVPYLLNADALQLNDIVTQLRRSRDFRPLLHFAWRQPVFEKNTSQPLKVFAGDNIQGQYLKNLASYHQEQKANIYEEQMLNNIFALSEEQSSLGMNTPIADDTRSAHTISQQLKAEKINEILANINQIDTVEEVVASLSNPANETQDSYSIDTKLMQPKPLPPVQPWYLQGLIDVFLIGNFLHVATDFSILNMTLAEQESLKLKSQMLGETINSEQVIPIRMTQNRRMISREIHYFDHPYMGIIMQIRRHQRPEIPEDDISENLDEVSQ